MPEITEVLKSILFELQKINDKLDEIKGDGLYNSVSDVCDKLDNIIGDGVYNSISDICDKLECDE